MFFGCLLHLRAALIKHELFLQPAKGSKMPLETQQFELKIPFLKLGIKGGWEERGRDLVVIPIHSENGVTKERERQGRRKKERKSRALNTKENCSTGVNI